MKDDVNEKITVFDIPVYIEKVNNRYVKAGHCIQNITGCKNKSIL